VIETAVSGNPPAGLAHTVNGSPQFVGALPYARREWFVIRASRATRCRSAGSRRKDSRAPRWTRPRSRAGGRPNPQRTSALIPAALACSSSMLILATAVRDLGDTHGRSWRAAHCEGADTWRGTAFLLPTSDGRPRPE
jgi:hypothetical protein